jgi:tRNA 2-thiouridine synthesizing protein A
MNTETMTILDARGMNCPLPILKTKKALNQMEVGELLSIKATDPGSVKDIKSFCEQTGDELVSSDNADGIYQFVIRKA